MFRDDFRNLVSRPVLAALAVLTMSTVALAAPQTGANKIELQDSSAKRVVLNSSDVSRIGVQTVPVREENVVRRVVVLGKVEDEPTGNAATDAGDLAPAAATNSRRTMRPPSTTYRSASCWIKTPLTMPMTMPANMTTKTMLKSWRRATTMKMKRR